MSQCRIEVFSGALQKEQKFTVGDVFLLKCDGNFAKLKSSPNKESLKIEFSKPDSPAVHSPESPSLEASQPPPPNYQLVLLNAELSDTQAILQVTSYTTGSIKVENAKLTDGVESIELSPVTFEVMSVMDPKAPQQEPYGPMGPISLHMPLWVYLSFIFVFLFILVLLSWKLYKSFRRRKLLKALHFEQIAANPIYELAKSLRQLQNEIQKKQFDSTEQTSEKISEKISENISEKISEQKSEQQTKQQSFLQDIDKCFRRYLSRQFKMPAMTWSYSEIKQDLKKFRPLDWKNYGDQVSELMKEIDSANKSQLSGKMLSRDYEQICEMLKNLADKIYLNSKSDSKLETKGMRG